MWFRRRKRETELEETVLGGEYAVNFDSTVEEIRRLSAKAQATFLYRLVGVLPRGVLKTLHHYTTRQLGYDKDRNVGQSNGYSAGSAGAGKRGAA